MSQHWGGVYWHVQSTPLILRLLEAKIRERKLSGSPVILRFRAKAKTQDLQSHLQLSKQYVERW